MGVAAPAGRSFALLGGIEGRVEDVLLLPGSTGPVRIHPNVFHAVLDIATTAGWQVIQEPSSLRVLLVGLAPTTTTDRVHTDTVSALKAAGAIGTQVSVQLVDAVERTPLGKAPLVRGLHRQP